MARARLTRLLWVALWVAAGCGDGESDRTCSTIGELCGGATSCYASCFCESNDDAGCRSRCAVAPDSPLVRDVSNWAADAEEVDLLSLINAQRAAGGCCAVGRCFGPALPLAGDGALTLAARRHAADMAERGYFSHDTPEGVTVEDRIRAAGYRGCIIGEDLGAEYVTGADVLAAWLASLDHCENLFLTDFTKVGIARSGAPGSSPSTVFVADFGG